MNPQEPQNPPVNTAPPSPQPANPVTPDKGWEMTQYSSYKEVPVFRRWWFNVVWLVICIPVAIIILLTGDIYHLKNGVVVKMTKERKKFQIIVLVLITILLASRAL